MSTGNRGNGVGSCRYFSQIRRGGFDLRGFRRRVGTEIEIEGEIGMVQVGAHARLMSQALRKINVNAAKANTTILFLNQLRSKVGVIYGNPEVTTGGNALKYYSSVRLDIRRKKSSKAKPARTISERE